MAITEQQLHDNLILNEIKHLGSTIVNYGGAVPYQLVNPIRSRSSVPVAYYNGSASPCLTTSTANVTFDNRLVSMWFYRGAGSTDNVMLSRMNGGGNLNISVDLDGHLHITFSAFNVYNPYITTQTLAIGSWNHVAFMHYQVSGQTWEVKVFLNNVLEYTQAYSTRNMTSYPVGCADFQMQIRTSTGVASGQWIGWLYDLSIFNCTTGTPIRSDLVSTVDALYNNNLG